MEIDIDRQKEAQEKAKELLAQEEVQRAERRLLKLVLDLENGKSDVLLNDELMENLPGLISTYCEEGDRERVKVLFEKLGECACSETSKLRERAVMALSLCMSGLHRENQPDLVEQVSGILLRWLRAETLFLSVCGTVCKQLQENGIRMLEEGLWKESHYLLDVFHQIQSGIQEKNNAIRSIVGRAQETLATDYILEELTIVCLRGRGDRRQNAEKTLILLGRKAAIHLLDILLASEVKEDRLRLVGLIPAIGYAAIPVFKEYLKKDLPWYGIRNIVLMITAMDEQDLIPLIMPCLKETDIRIQQQVIDCISEVAEDNPGGYLLAALPQVNDVLKVALVGYLGQLGLPETSEVFLDLLSDRDSFSLKVRDDLLQSLAVQIRLSESVRAVNLLTMLLDERKEEFDPKTDPVSQVVSQTLKILTPRFKKKEISSEAEGEANSEPEQIQKLKPLDIVPESDSELDQISFTSDPVTQNAAKRDLQKINEEVSILLGKGQVTEASQMLYEKCLEAAREKNFDAAEMLRDRILEVDPNALAEVIKAGEQIEEERSSTITSNHISVWQDLYDSLTTEEFNALYYSLKSKDYTSGDVIVEQGTMSPFLYFINSGKARLTCWRDTEEIFLKKIGPGEIVGAGPFFDVSVWTVALTALGKTNVHILERGKFLELLDQHPGLEPCLLDYCLKTEMVPQLLEMSGEDRRGQPRHPVSLIVKHTLLDEFGNPSMRSFNGEIVDFSSGGLSFFIRISRKENARLLLGRGIKTSIRIAEDKVVDCTGQIVAVRFQSYVDSDYSVHVEFNEHLSGKTLQKIMSGLDSK